MDYVATSENLAESEKLIIILYNHLLGRAPRDIELKHWITTASTRSPLELITLFTTSVEYKEKHKVACFFPAGHYYSPVVNPEEVRSYVKHRATLSPLDFPGISIDFPAMVRFCEDHKSVFRSAPFTEQPTPDNRFYYNASPFPYGDAITLYTLMYYFRPRRIVEIGSGYSTACMLDSAERHGIRDLSITCIEPYPARLKKMIRESDFDDRVTLIEKPVQSVPVLDVVGNLEANDILFIDSTHVLKTGSDVHYEIFEILPALKPGVIIHFHDCQYPFEYPDRWLFELNYSWNEIYALRAFLMFNDKFKVFFWGNMIKQRRSDLARELGDLFNKNAGGSIWLLRQS